MKKGISLFLAAIVCLNFSVTALAAEDNFTTSDTEHGVYAKIQDVSKPVYSVCLSWSSMCFAYETQVKWNPDTLEYERGKEGKWFPINSKEKDIHTSNSDNYNNTGNHFVTVTNNSNAAIKVKVTMDKDKNLPTSAPRHTLYMPGVYGTDIHYIPDNYPKNYKGAELAFGLRSAAIEGNAYGSYSKVHYTVDVIMENPTEDDFSKWLNKEYTIVGDVKVTLSAWDGINEHFDIQ